MLPDVGCVLDRPLTPALGEYRLPRDPSRARAPGSVLRGLPILESPGRGAHRPRRRGLLPNLGAAVERETGLHLLDHDSRFPVRGRGFSFLRRSRGRGDGVRHHARHERGGACAPCSQRAASRARVLTPGKVRVTTRRGRSLAWLGSHAPSQPSLARANIPSAALPSPLEASEREASRLSDPVRGAFQAPRAEQGTHLAARRMGQHHPRRVR